MFIGDVFSARMNMLCFSVKQLSEKTLVDVEIIDNIMKNRLELEEIDDFDLNVLACALYCEPEYFYDENIRSSDVMSSCYNRGYDTPKSALAKVKIQKMVKDIIFLREVLS